MHMHHRKRRSEGHFHFHSSRQHLVDIMLITLLGKSPGQNKDNRLGRYVATVLQAHPNSNRLGACLGGGAHAPSSWSRRMMGRNAAGCRWASTKLIGAAPRVNHCLATALEPCMAPAAQSKGRPLGSPHPADGIVGFHGEIPEHAMCRAPGDPVTGCTCSRLACA